MEDCERGVRRQIAALGRRDDREEDADRSDLDAGEDESIDAHAEDAALDPAQRVRDGHERHGQE
jgi:hypothetical protein